jgi:hypothetical protein
VNLVLPPSRSLQDPVRTEKPKPAEPAQSIYSAQDGQDAAKRLLTGSFTNTALPVSEYVVQNARLSYAGRPPTAFVSMYEFTNFLSFDSGVSTAPVTGAILRSSADRWRDFT